MRVKNLLIFFNLIGNVKFTKSILLRARIIFLSVVFFVLVISWKIFHLQFVEVDKWRNLAKATQLEYRPIIASRGNIYAYDGSLLATSLPFYRVALDPMLASDTSFNKEIDLLSHALSDFYKDKTPAHYKNRIINARKKKRRYLLLHTKNITYKEKKKMSHWPIFRQGRFKGGVLFEEQYKRYNPFKELARRTIGVYRATHGSGLEYAFNQILKGIDGQALYQKVVGGTWKQVAQSTMIPPVHGSDLITTLDINLQDVTQSSLLKTLEETNAQNGCAIVMEVATGAIKAIANLARTESGQYMESYNYAVGNQGTAEPGSIFKLVSMLALLEETGWPLNHPIDTGNGAIQFYNRWMKDVKKGGYGLLTLQEVFEKSSNVGISMAIDQIFGPNPKKFINYIKSLAIDQLLGIELVGEGKPYIITPKSKIWSGVTLPWLSIGYNVQLTPLQMLVLYNAIANNGRIVKPMFVQQIKSANGMVKNFPTTILKEKICSDETLHKLKVMLEGTVEKGLAQRIKHSFYKIAGKTGTAQKLVNGKYTDHHLTSFAGYFPANNPCYSCIIVVDSPQGETFRFGSEVPAPIFKDIVDRIAGKDLHARKPINGSVKAHPIQLFHVGATEQLRFLCTWLKLPLLENLPATEGWVSLQINGTEGKFKACNLEFSKSIPKVLDMKLRDALFLLEKSGLVVTVEGNLHGVVCKQSQLSNNHVTILLK